MHALTSMFKFNKFFPFRKIETIVLVQRFNLLIAEPTYHSTKVSLSSPCTLKKRPIREVHSCVPRFSLELRNINLQDNPAIFSFSPLQSSRMQFSSTWNIQFRPRLVPLSYVRSGQIFLFVD